MRVMVQKNGNDQMDLHTVSFYLINLGPLDIPLSPVSALLIASLLQMSALYSGGHQVQEQNRFLHVAIICVTPMKFKFWATANELGKLNMPESFKGHQHISIASCETFFSCFRTICFEILHLLFEFFNLIQVHIIHTCIIKNDQ